MKICEHCGNKNADELNYCVNCGNNLQNTKSVGQESNINENTENISQQNNNYQETYQQPNNPQTDYQQNYQLNKQVIPQKIIWLAPVINIILGIIIHPLLGGVGHFYLKLYKRGILICASIIIPIIIGLILIYTGNESILDIITIISMIIVIYSAYDAYTCGKAINENKQLPLLFGLINIQ